LYRFSVINHQIVRILWSSPHYWPHTLNSNRNIPDNLASCGWYFLSLMLDFHVDFVYGVQRRERSWSRNQNKSTQIEKDRKKKQSRGENFIIQRLSFLTNVRCFTRIVTGQVLTSTIRVADPFYALQVMSQSPIALVSKLILSSSGNKKSIQVFGTEFRRNTLRALWTRSGCGIVLRPYLFSKSNR
jgi:hypothetical protein